MEPDCIAKCASAACTVLIISVLEAAFDINSVALVTKLNPCNIAACGHGNVDSHLKYTLLHVHMEGLSLLVHSLLL